MAVPTITKPANVVSHRGETITPFKVKASETPLTAPKWTNPKIVPPSIELVQGEELEIKGTIAVGDALATTTVGLVAHNATGNSAEQTFTWQVMEQVPVITKPAKQTGNKGKAITPFTVATTGGAVTKIEAAGLPEGLAIAETGAKIGEVTGTPTGAVETAKVKLNAETLDKTKAVEVEFEFQIVGVPAITKPSTQQSTRNKKFELSLVATESPTEWSISNLPEGLTINNSGEILGTPTERVGFYSKVTVKATNSDGTGETTFLFIGSAPSNPEIDAHWTASHGWS